MPPRPKPVRADVTQPGPVAENDAPIGSAAGNATDTRSETVGGNNTPATTDESNLQATEDLIREEIERLERIKSLQAQKATLEKEIAEAGGHDYGALPTRQRHARSSESDSGGEVRITNITQLTMNATSRVRDEWLSDLKRAFMGRRRKFARDTNKILLATDHMDKACRAEWDAHVNEQESEEKADRVQSDWKGFVAWSEGLLKEAANQDLSMVRRFSQAHQREGQSPRDFAQYLASLERHLPREEEKWRSLRFVSKLQKPLQEYIDVHHPSREYNSREDTVSFTETMWWAMEKDKGNKKRNSPRIPEGPNKRLRSNRNDPSWGRQPHSYSPRQGTPRPTPKGEGPQNLTCYNCGGEGHWANRCPKPRQEKKPGNERQS
jgi:hypothetical protein